jgi:hypothetical protein
MGHEWLGTPFCMAPAAKTFAEDLPPPTCPAASPAQVVDAQASILNALTSVKGRGKSGLTDEQREELEAAVKQLEEDGGIMDVTAKEEALDGKWRLLYTSRPGSASPIQNTFTVSSRNPSVLQKHTHTHTQHETHSACELTSFLENKGAHRTIEACN